MGFYNWLQDYGSRTESLKAFANITQAVMQEGQGVWRDNRYVIVHFDLISIPLVGEAPLSRSDVYEKLHEIVENNGGTRLGGSVYMVPMGGMQETSEQFAAMLWNRIQLDTAGKLISGDSFFVHYSPDIKNHMGGIAQVVPIGQRQLRPAIVPA